MQRGLRLVSAETIGLMMQSLGIEHDGAGEAAGNDNEMETD